MGRAITHGILVGIPVATVVLAIAIRIVGDLGWGAAIETAILPGVLVGVFFGGFAGLVRTMD